MYKAVYYLDSTSFESAKKSPTVIEAFEPLLMVIVDDADPNPGLASKIKNTLLFSDYDMKPTNKAVITLTGIGGATNEAAIAWLTTNKVTIVRDLFNFGMMIIDLPKNSSFSAFEARVAGLSWCASISQDFLLQAEPAYAFNYGQHWHLGNVGAQESWALMDPYASNANNCNDRPQSNATSSGTRDIEGGDCCSSPEIALLDVGVQTNHPDLLQRFGTCGCTGGDPVPVFTNPGARVTVSGSCTNNWNVVNNNSDVNPQFVHEKHGTAMAGIISGDTLNNNYIMSVSNNYIKTQVLRIGYTTNAANFFYTTPAWTLEGLYRAAANPSCAAIVIPWTVSNANSIASFEAIVSPVFSYITEQARECTGIPIFASAGNSNTSTLPYPAQDSYILAIGASTSANVRAVFSNKGAGIFAAAPGVQIRTTDRTGPVGYSVALADPSLPASADINFTNFATTLFTGTSASAAMVAAIAGCMRAVNPVITAAQIKTIFEETSLAAVDLGAGIVRMQDAVQAAIDLISPVEDLTVTVAIMDVSPSPIVICGGLVVIETEVEGSGATWNQVTSVTLEYFISEDQGYTSNDFLLDSHTFPVNNVTNTYTWPATIPNIAFLVGQRKLFVRATFGTNCGQIISNGGQEFISNSQGVDITYANCPGTDLSVDVLSVSYPNPTLRLFQYRFTNTGTVPVSAANITRGWIGGASSLYTFNWNGTTSSTAPLQPGQSRIVNLSYNTPATQWPAIFYTQINTVNGGTDFNTTNNYDTLTVTQ